METRSKEELFNTLTHLAGVVFTLSTAYILLRLGYASNWRHAFGTTFFTCGMLLLYAASTLYHWCPPGRLKQRFRVLDHVSIYVMIAASYTPICIGIVGDTLGWVVFAVLWAVVLAGTVYKIAAIDRYPRLSLALYLVMGWTFVFIAGPVVQHVFRPALWCILAEGAFYSSGTWFFAHDSRPWHHGIWHLFVLAGSVCHWVAILLILTHH